MCLFIVKINEVILKSGDVIITHTEYNNKFWTGNIKQVRYFNSKVQR
jgi:hypothetical protein